MHYIAHCKGIRVRMTGDETNSPMLEWSLPHQGSSWKLSTAIPLQVQGTEEGEGVHTFIGDLTGNSEWSENACNSLGCSRRALLLKPNQLTDFRILSIEIYELP